MAKLSPMNSHTPIAATLKSRAQIAVVVFLVMLVIGLAGHLTREIILSPDGLSDSQFML